MSISKPTIAFFGSTGGSVAAALTDALHGGYTSRALVRSRSKLEKLLAERNVPQDLIAKHLTIIEGNVKDTTAVSRNIMIAEKKVVDIIISGVGGIPTFTPNPLKPGLDDPTICEDATNTYLAALRSISPAKKPLVVALSTTGMSDAGRDIPLVMVPLYHWMLAVPHQDKKIMEQLLTAEVTLPDNESVISGFIVVRASLLTSGARLGVDKVRVGVKHPRLGTEENKEANVPAIGYTISREDVGGWIYAKIIEQSGGDYVNKYITITY